MLDPTSRLLAGAVLGACLGLAGACDPGPPSASPSVHCGDPVYAAEHGMLCFGGCKDPAIRQTPECAPCEGASDDPLCGGTACETDCGSTTDGGSTDAGSSGESGEASTEATGSSTDDGAESSESTTGGSSTGVGSDAIATGLRHTCALRDGRVRCWGSLTPNLGYPGAIGSIGVGESPSVLPDVEVGGPVAQIVAGDDFTCALLESGAVRCWGFNNFGRLGYGHTDTIGDDEHPEAAGDVPLGGTAVALSTQSATACALLDTGGLRCWGFNPNGEAGYPFADVDIGDDETPADMGDVDIDGTVVQVTSGLAHTCVLLDTGDVRCFGSGTLGQLGYGNTNNIGDDEPPYVAGNVSVGGTVVEVVALGLSTCVLLDDAAVRCWGFNSFGTLGQGDTETIGDDELPSSIPTIELGDTVEQIDGWGNIGCARLSAGDLRCWGRGFFGALGVPGITTLGDDEAVTSVLPIDVGGAVADVSIGSDFVCVRMQRGFGVRCWGGGASGALGYGNIEDIGDDEHPSSQPEVSIW